MTTIAGARYVAVVKACTQPGVGIMAIITFCSRLDMCWMLTCCCNPVMTTATGARYVAVIETGIAPGVGVMTAVALIIRHNMCRVLAGSSNAVMAGTTGANDSIMVHATNTIKSDGVMAIFTSCCRKYM